MIPAIVIIAIAFGWLGKETNWLTIRLPVGNAKSSNDRTTDFESVNVGLNPALATKPIDKNSPYWWQSPELKQTHLNLCVGCRMKCQEHKTERWCGWKLPALTIRAFNSTLNLNEGCNIWRAKFLKQVAREVRRKTTVSSGQAPLPNFIEQVRLGSHQEWVETDDKGHGYHNITTDYTTHYHDCIPGKAWLKKHEHDEYPEPMIELSIDGKTLSVNGNYKKGEIQTFMSQYTQKVRAGKKVLTVQKGGHVENCEGGVYIAVNE